MSGHSVEHNPNEEEKRKRRPLPSSFADEDIRPGSSGPHTTVLGGSTEPPLESMETLVRGVPEEKCTGHDDVQNGEHHGVLLLVPPCGKDREGSWASGTGWVSNRLLRRCFR
ncbi:hypothetical protein RUM44_006527 [Polyplax serrata]|uniref:Uncharacterized protein n=1 Tax=Polyplax serrata TaxID=468196 RepID=A0ABR1AJW1_POLSC